MTENLTVQPERLGVLASHHDNAAVDASSGVEAAAGLGESVAITHGPYCSQFNDTLNVYLTAHNALGSSLHTAGVDLAKSLRIARRYIARPTKRGARLSTGCLPDHVCCPQCRPQRLPNDLFGLTTPAAQADPSRVAMNSEGTVDLPGNDFDSNDFDAVDLWGADGAEGWTADPIIGVGSAATPDTGPDLDNAHGQAETDTEQEIALFTVTNPPRTVSVSTLMDGRIDHVELSARVAWMSESQLASEILVIADLARQKAQSAQYAFILDRMSQQVDADEHRVALLRKTVGETWGLPSPEEAAAAEAEVFATRYSDDCPAPDDESDPW